MIKIILSLHERFWHCPATRLIPMLQRASSPKEVLVKIADVMRLCPRCAQSAPPKNRAIVRATFALHFSHQIEADCFVR